MEIEIKDFIDIDAASVADAFIKNHSIEAFDEYMFALQRLMSDLYHRIDGIKNAIKDNITDDYYYDDSSSENSDEYSRLRDEFNSEFLLKKCCGKESFDEFSDEEWDIYNDKDTGENFADWLVNEKGYSREVADATTIYNECGEWGEYHAYYYIDEVEFIKCDIKGNGN